VENADSETPDSGKSDPVGPLAKPTTTEELRKRVTFLLSGYEFFPTRDDLDRVGAPADVVAVLVDIVGDEDASAMHRLRAVDALGFYELPQVAGFLRKLTRGAKAADLKASARHSSLLQHHAITALARSQNNKSVPDLEVFLDGKDLQLKLTAIVALGKHGKVDGRERLKQLVKSDDNKLVQREAKKYLR
jgi:HEAT repeat protein